MGCSEEGGGRCMDFSLLLTCLFWKSMQGMVVPLRQCWQGSISRAEHASCAGDGLSISGRCFPSYHLSEELHELSHNMLSEHTTLFISVSPFYRGGNWDPERLSDLLKVTHRRSEAETCTLVSCCRDSVYKHCPSRLIRFLLANTIPVNLQSLSNRQA